jgi:hypothetical protein
MFLLVVSLMTLPTEGFEQVQQIVIKDKKAKEYFLANSENCSSIFIYLDKEERKLIHWLKDVAHLFSHKDFVFCHSSWISSSRTTPNWLKHVPGLVTFSYPMCTIGAGPCNQMARLTSNSTNLKAIRLCKCHKRTFSSGFARTDQLIKLITWYGDNVLGVSKVMGTQLGVLENPSDQLPSTHNLYQTESNKGVEINVNDITLTINAHKAAVEAYPTDSAEKKRDAKRAAKAAGKEIIVKKRPKNIEDHHDDCGTSLAGLGVDLETA